MFVSLIYYYIPQINTFQTSTLKVKNTKPADIITLRILTHEVISMPL